MRALAIAAAASVAALIGALWALTRACTVHDGIVH
jgi:hypothetical protein